MKTTTLRTAAWRPARRCLTVFRSLSPVTVIGLTLGIVVGGMGIADAATGGDFILGRANSETSKATLSNSHGTPLALVAPKNTAPLAVNRQTMVPNLNAEFVGGLSATQVKSTGGDGYTDKGDLGMTIPHLSAVRVARTGSLPAGTYYVTATAELKLQNTNPGAECFITIGSDATRVQEGGENGGPFITAAETVAVSIRANATLQEWCEVQGTGDGTVVENSGITAIRIMTSHGKKGATNQPAAHSEGTK